MASAHPTQSQHGGEMDSTVSELAQLLQNPDAAGIGNDPATREIFENLTRNLASMYQGSGPGGAAGAGYRQSPSKAPPAPPGQHGAAVPPAPGAPQGDGMSPEGDYSEDEGSYSDGYSDGEGTEEYYPSVREMMGNRPLPVDLWRAAHESSEAPREERKLTTGEWEDLVDRLNESSKAKQAYLLQAQHRQIADELSGLTFTPHITKRSRELAAHNKALPERMAALLRRKKAKIDKVKHERARAELSEATFQPKLNTQKKHSSRRRVGHLMKYEIERRIRQTQRKQILQEVEDRELTFSPQINPNSMRIVQRVTKERISKAEEARQLLAKGDEAAAAEAAAASLGKTTARAIQREQAAVAASTLAQVERQVKRGKLRRIPLGPVGLTMLPGHEEERFHPKVNERSRQVAVRNAQYGRNVYDRLYGHATELVKKKRGAAGKHGRSARSVGDGTDFGVTYDEDGLEETGSSERKVTSDGISLHNTADYVNVVPYAEKFDFLVRKVVEIADEMSMGASMQ